MWYCLSFIIGFLLSGICFGGNLMLQNIFVRKKLFWLQGMSMVIISIIPTVIIGIYFCDHPFHYNSILNWNLWLIAIVTVTVTFLIIMLKHDNYQKEPLMPLCLEAAFMEIPQRVMMQTLVCGLLSMHNAKTGWGIIITGLIWCASILVQTLVTKQNNLKHFALELIASFVFSMGIGYVFYVSDCLVIPMLAHATERYVTRKYL